MAGVKKLVQKMKNRPNGIRFNELEKVLNHYGYILVRSKGSHHHFRNDEGDVLPVPKEHPIKAVYIKEALKRIGEA
ncbi:type II toxin-antitoxin system HicA family toxin [Kroppenstedtia sanguinis]|uniref:Type II toxin-antitoxin system HicA family toxin n=1 Tax=Kroppenstedtia sanguinis TaxID=1380684 RepID=A0ABW4C483_9BACL